MAQEQDMTPEEWKERCAKRYIERAGIDASHAAHLADICFEEEARNSDKPFSSTAKYHPEDCADNDMDCWDA